MTIHLEISGARFAITTPEEKWDDVIAELWRPFVLPAFHDGAYEVQMAAEQGRYLLSTPSKDDVTVEDPWLALLALRNVLDEQMLKAAETTDLHASVVGRGDELLLLPGESGAGKTTLTLHLTTRGWSFGGDDVCPLDLGSGRVRALPRPIGLRSVGDLPVGLWEWPPWLGRPSFAMLFPATVLPHITTGDYAPTRIAFVRFVPGSGSEMTQLSVAESIARLGSHIRPLRAEAVSGLRSLCSSVRSIDLVYGTPEEGALALREWSE